MYTIKKAKQLVNLTASFEQGAWKDAENLAIAVVRPESSVHHPIINARMLYDDMGIYLRFEVQDRYVVARKTNYQDGVCSDSCVEFFIQPKGRKDYYNFEMNAIGTVLLYNVVDPTRAEHGFKDYSQVPFEKIQGMNIATTLHGVIDPEITEPVDWSLSAFIPFSIFDLDEKVKSGDVWRGNLYKCADKSSHPHWISAFPLSVLNYHLPECFQEICFE
ncbi:MAG: carbohydrate-binding family 9-like protein [Lentisphaeria bacterium]|nr:carbohydrate-binding family 9-like protein [Lentisphaeria bacterium]